MSRAGTHDEVLATLGVLDETTRIVARSIWQALTVVGPYRLVVAPRCGMKERPLERERA